MTITNADVDELARERDARKRVAKQGHRLQKSRSRNDRAPEYGMYRIVDPVKNWVVAGAHPWNYSMTLDEVVDWIEA